MLPMEFGALLRSTRYPVVRVHPAEPVPGSPIRDQFLIDRSDRGFTVWDPSTRRITWVPAGDVARMETIAVRDLFRPEEHQHELQSLMRSAYDVLLLNKNKI